MSSSTSRLQLTKLADSENFSNTVLNANWDKVDNGYGTLNSQITSIFKTKNYTATKSIPSGYGYITATEFNFATPTGYTPIGILDFSSSANGLSIRAVSGKATGAQGAMWFANGSSSAVSTDASITVLYAPTGYVNT